MPMLNCSGRRRVQVRHPQATHVASPPKMKTTKILSATGPMLHTVNPLQCAYSITCVISSDGRDNCCKIAITLIEQESLRQDQCQLRTQPAVYDPMQ